MTALSDSDLNALRNLAGKQKGEPVPFINIAAARSLTDLGLATRNREGWEITSEGLALLLELDRGPVTPRPSS